MVEDTWSVLNLSLTILELHQEDTSQSLISRGLKVDLESDANILVRAENPESLVFPVIDLTRREIALAFKDLFHRLTDWCTHEISLEAGIFKSNSVTCDISLLPDLFVLGPDSIGLLSAHLLFNLLGLLDAASINGDSDLRVWVTLIFRKDKPFVELIKHFLPTILQYGL